MNAYMYRADLYCEGCAEKIIADLVEPGYPEPWDTDDYPAGPFPDGGGEADCPWHCGSCGVFLENPLTSDGYEYVRESVQEAIDANPVVSQWAEYYNFTPTSPEC